MSANFPIIAKTLFGFEDLLARELAGLGASDIKPGVRNVSFVGDYGFLYKANLNLRTAIKVLMPIAMLKIHTEDDLYRKILAINWDLYLSPEQTFVVDSVSVSPKFKHTLFLSQRVKDAIVDKFRQTHGKRPSVDTDNPDLRIHVHMGERSCHISLDSSGGSLHKRGYRTITNIAPINEVLAAGLLLHSGWDGRSHFLDPMCGSGTLLIEAAMIACNIPPNINRKEFAFMKWNNYSPELFETIRNSSLNKIREHHYSIRGYDKAPSAVEKTIQNVENANLSEYIKVERRDFFHTSKEVEGPLHMVFNPPYGQRLNIDSEAFYGSIGDTLKKGYPGTQAWFVTADPEAHKFVGLRPSRKIKVMNGNLESRLLKYEIYEGSKKAKFQTPG
ncbi:MAG: THUMP domain-containing protein [Flavobacteriaceae bacterium]|nr:THUMP domain-containing protein [Flavobacteriaceae bacterium]MDH3796716.1 THUMP domain-containing protein [Flavobacteriaceae bacterium]